MKVAEYHREGLRYWVDAVPEGFEPLGQEAREQAHWVAFFAKVKGGQLADVVFLSSRRCRKLLALADVAATRLQGQPREGYALDADALLAFLIVPNYAGGVKKRALKRWA